MNGRTLRAALALSILAACAQAIAAETIVFSGSACQPATSTDATEVKYTDGRLEATYGTSTVVCPLPPVPPGYRIVEGAVFILNPLDRWGKIGCRFYNVGGRNSGFVSFERAAGIVGAAMVDIDRIGFPVHSASCTLVAPMILHSLEIVVEPR